MVSILFKGLLTISGYITKIKKITGSCTQTAVISYLTLQNWRKWNVTKIFRFKVEGWYFQTSAEIMLSAAKPMRAHVIDQSLNEFIMTSYYLLPLDNHCKLADLFSFHNYNDRLWLANQKPNTDYITGQVECLECRNSKSSRQKLYTFGCKYLNFNTVYRLETFGIHLYSSPLRACKVLSKSKIWPKIWLEGF